MNIELIRAYSDFVKRNRLAIGETDTSRTWTMLTYDAEYKPDLWFRLPRFLSRPVLWLWMKRR